MSKRKRFFYDFPKGKYPEKKSSILIFSKGRGGLTKIQIVWGTFKKKSKLKQIFSLDTFPNYANFHVVDDFSNDFACPTHSHQLLFSWPGENSTPGHFFVNGFSIVFSKSDLTWGGGQFLSQKYFWKGQTS